jgi:hypothetical protein
MSPGVDSQQCKIFFSDHANDNEKVKALQQKPDPLACEHISVSDYSPGVVQNEEHVVRQVTHPTFVDEDSQCITPAWFDDIFNKGFSCDRLSFTTNEEVIQRGRQRATEFNANPQNSSKRQRTLHSLGRLNIANVRAITSNEAQACGVYDTAHEQNPAHADICYIIQNQTPMMRRSVRSKLFEITTHANLSEQ